MSWARRNRRPQSHINPNSLRSKFCFPRKQLCHCNPGLDEKQRWQPEQCRKQHTIPGTAWRLVACSIGGGGDRARDRSATGGVHLCTANPPALLNHRSQVTHCLAPRWRWTGSSLCSVHLWRLNPDGLNEQSHTGHNTDCRVGGEGRATEYAARQACRFCARGYQFCGMPNLFRSSAMRSFHLRRGPSGARVFSSQPKQSCLGMWSSDILATWPSHSSHLRRIMSDTSSASPHFAWAHNCSSAPTADEDETHPGQFADTDGGKHPAWLHHASVAASIQSHTEGETWHSRRTASSWPVARVLGPGKHTAANQMP